MERLAMTAGAPSHAPRRALFDTSRGRVPSIRPAAPRSWPREAGGTIDVGREAGEEQRRDRAGPVTIGNDLFRVANGTVGRPAGARGAPAVPTGRRVTLAGRSEAAFGECDTSEGKCQAPPAAPAPPAPAPAGPAPAPAPAAPAPAGVVHTMPGITWSKNYASSAAAGASTTVEHPFVPTYKPILDAGAGVWHMDVTSVTGGVDITVRTGGSTDPIASPPASEADASAAVTDMKGYYARGSRGSWHTEAASRAHEEHHEAEWHCTSDDYWRTARWRINQLTAPVAANATEAAATATMRAGAGGADAIMAAFRTTCRTYWFMLADNASSRPYAAGQLVLNNAVRSVQALAATKGWAVPQGTDAPSAANPCYLPKPLWPP